MLETMIVIEIKIPRARRKMPKERNRLEPFAGHEYRASSQQSRKKLPCHDDFAACGRQKIKVQAAVKDLATE